MYKVYILPIIGYYYFLFCNICSDIFKTLPKITIRMTFLFVVELFSMTMRIFTRVCPCSGVQFLPRIAEL